MNCNQPSHSYLRLTAVSMLLTIIVTASVASLPYKEQNSSYGLYSLVHVYPTEGRSLKALVRDGYDIVDASHPRFFVVVAKPGDLARLQTSGYSFREIVPDIAASAQRSQPATDETDLIQGFLTYSETVDSLVVLHIMYPNLVSDTIRIGTTEQNRAIYAIKISDNVNVDEDEPEVFYNAMIHAREQITHTEVFYFIHYLLTNYSSNTRVQNIVDNRELWFVPTVNPDGMVYNETHNPNGFGMWRKNCRVVNGSPYGVDLNRNFGSHWGANDFGSSPDPMSETYRGQSAFSEPETQALREFMANRHFRITINSHSAYNAILHPIAWRREWSPDHQLFHNLGKRWSNNSGYQVGPVWDVLWYNSNGDAPDFQYDSSPDSMKNFAFVTEIGSRSGDTYGFWPQQDSIVPLCQQMLETNLQCAEFAAEPRIVLPPPVPDLTLPDSFPITTPIPFTCSDPINPPVNYDMRVATEYPIGTESFEGSLDNWIFKGDVTIDSTQAHTGRKSLYLTIWTQLKAIAQTNHPVVIDSNDVLQYWAKYHMGTNVDWLFTQISFDEGLHWYSLAGNRTSTDSTYGSNWDYGITGTTNDMWVNCQFPLNQYAGRSAIFRVILWFDYSIDIPEAFIDGFSPALTITYPFDYVCNAVQDSALRFGTTGRYLTQIRARDADGDTSCWTIPKWVTAVTNTARENVEIPISTELSNAFPNPFNATATISYRVAHPGTVVLKLYDLQGREIGSLVDEWQQVGTYRTVIDGSKLASGTYFYQMQTGSFNQTRKLVLLK